MTVGLTNISFGTSIVNADPKDRPVTVILPKKGDPDRNLKVRITPGQKVLVRGSPDPAQDGLWEGDPDGVLMRPNSRKIAWPPERLDVGVELPAAVWARWVREIEAWNHITFGSGAAWINLTADEAMEALRHFKLSPLVTGLTAEGRAGRLTVHYAAASAVKPDQLARSTPGTSKINPERFVITSTQGDQVRFAMMPGLPSELKRIAEPYLNPARASAEQSLRAARAAVTDSESGPRPARDQTLATDRMTRSIATLTQSMGALNHALGNAANQIKQASKAALTQELIDTINAGGLQPNTTVPVISTGTEWVPIKERSKDP